MSTTPARSRILLFAAIAFTVLAWASAFVVIRGVAPEVGGGALALGRLTVGVIALGLLMAVQRKWVRPTGRDWVRLVVYGVGWFGAYNIALNLAEHTLDAGTTAMIVNIGPILIALGAGLFLGEGIPRWLAIGAGVAFLGVILIGIGTSFVSGGARPIDPVGVLWCLLAAVTYAIGVLAPFDTSPWMIEVLRGAMEQVQATHFSLVLHAFPSSAGEMARFADQLHNGSMDALLVV